MRCSSGSGSGSSDPQRADRRRRPVHPQADRDHAGGRDRVRAARGGGWGRGAGRGSARAPDARVPRRRHARDEWHRCLPGAARAPGHEPNDDRDAHRGARGRSRAQRRGGGSRPVPDQAVQPAGPASTGRSPERPELAGVSDEQRFTATVAEAGGGGGRSERSTCSGRAPSTLSRTPARYETLMSRIVLITNTTAKPTVQRLRLRSTSEPPPNGPAPVPTPNAPDSPASLPECIRIRKTRTTQRKTWTTPRTVLIASGF